MLEDIICNYMDGIAEFDDIVDFCDGMEPNEENKQMLIECMGSFDIGVLYETLFDKFEDLLTAEETEKYRKKFSELFD